jgi:NADH-quinone oxidoreductase E subunit
MSTHVGETDREAATIRYSPDPHDGLEFSDTAKKRLEWLRTRYPKDHQRALVLPVLSMAQREFGWCSPKVVQYVASVIPVPVIQVEEVATFYTMYNKRPIGRWHLQVCHNLSCSLMGADIVIEHIEEKLGIHRGETTSDGQFTLMGAECLGSCGTAPMMQVNDHYHENLTLQDVDDLLMRLRAKDDIEDDEANLAFGPGSGPSRALPMDAPRLEAGAGVIVPGGH